VVNSIDWFNVVEAIFWFAFAPLAVFALRGFSPWRERLLFAAIVMAFGVSDLVEIHTGGWWRPWWLAAWKVSVAAAGLFIIWRIISRSRTST
jgi:hypothetical protein